MRLLRNFWKQPAAICAGWIAICFTLASAAWISWSYHLTDLAGAQAADIHSMVIGYLLQAAGAGLTSLTLSRQAEARYNRLFRFSVALLLATCLPALLGGYLWAAGFGMALNLLCGVVAGFYLYAASKVEAGKRGAVFGAGYGVSTAAVWLMSLARRGAFLRSGAAMAVYLVLAVAAAWLAGKALGAREEAQPPAGKRGRAGLPLTLGVVALMSLVKNLGFSFPSADIQSGVSMELSRLFYAAGLMAAGVIGDRDRKNGAICAAASLAIPFVAQAISGEAVPAMIVWGLDYFFFGFFSVYRAVLLMDMAADEGRVWLAPLGLAAGRVGDALGTAACMALSGSRVALVGLTLALFIVTLFLFFWLYQALYMPEAVQEKSEREVFEGFSMQHDLSAREKEVLRLALSEQSNAQIAEALFVSESTIKYHMHNVLQKTGCRSRQDLIRKYNTALYPRLGKG